MQRMFGKRAKGGSSERVPGKPYENMDSPQGKAKENPANYEGKEHVKYKNPGFSSHQDKDPGPKMKSSVSKKEMHEAEDNYHMDVPNQTPKSLPKVIKRATMKMDAPNQQDPKPLLGNLVRMATAKGVKDESGEEQMGPNTMQSDSKEKRKKMIVAVTKRKMKKG